jgi:hypothetical protein
MLSFRLVIMLGCIVLRGASLATDLTLDLEAAFEAEAIKQLDLGYEAEPPTELETLKRENEGLKQRVSELERRLLAVEMMLKDGE